MTTRAKSLAVTSWKRWMKKVIAVHLLVLNCVESTQRKQWMVERAGGEKLFLQKKKSSWQAEQLQRRRRNRPAFHFTQDEQTAEEMAEIPVPPV